MSDLISASTGELNSTHQGFMQKVDDFSNAASAITNAVQALQSTWKGQGNLSFNTVMGTWNTDLRKITTDLENLAKGLGITSQEFLETDQAAAKLFNGFGG